MFKGNESKQSNKFIYGIKSERILIMLTYDQIILLLNWKTILIYVIVINFIAFFAMGIDKYKAKRGSWRISENALLTLVILGGGIGGIMGMYTFRHKTQKLKFSVGFPVILITEIIVVVYFLVFFSK